MKTFLPLILAAVAAILFIFGIYNNTDAMVMVVVSLVVSVAGFIVFKTIYKSDNVLAGIGRIGCASMIVINAVYIVTFIIIQTLLTGYISNLSI